MDQKLASVLVPEKMSWTTSTRSIRKCQTRIEKIGGSCVDTEPTAWGLDAQVWNLLWTGEEAMKKGIPILKRAGLESIENLPRTAVGMKIAFIITRKRNNVVVSFRTLKVQSFMLTEARD